MTTSRVRCGGFSVVTATLLWVYSKTHRRSLTVQHGTYARLELSEYTIQGDYMATKKHGIKSIEWAKHLRPFGKRRANKQVRKDGKKGAKCESS